MNYNTEHKQKEWKFKTEITNTVFDSFDFSFTNFNSAIFENIRFKNCLFNKAILQGTKIFYSSYFENCKFISVDLRNTTVGSNKGIYKNCLFEKCNFNRQLFNFTSFEDCEFVKSKFKSVSFNGSTFNCCKFIGKLEDVEFNGIYDTNKDPSICLNKVDFSDAVFGEFVTFNNCRLDNCIPPTGVTFDELLYRLYANDPAILSTGSTDKIVIK